MTYLTPLLADLGSLNPLTPGQPVDRSTGLVFRDLMLILLVGAVLTLLLVLWARHYVRTKQRRRKPHAHSHTPREHPRSMERSSSRSDDSGEEGEDDEGNEGGDRATGEPGRRRRRRRRRRQRDHRPRNPTLAQTGGLPPAKGPAESPPGS